MTSREPRFRERIEKYGGRALVETVVESERQGIHARLLPTWASLLRTAANYDRLWPHPRSVPNRG